MLPTDDASMPAASKHRDQLLCNQMANATASIGVDVAFVPFVVLELGDCHQLRAERLGQRERGQTIAPGGRRCGRVCGIGEHVYS